MCSDLHKGSIDTTYTGTGSTLGDSVLFCRYYRLPLPTEGAPLEEDFDAFVNILRVSRCKNANHTTKTAVT